MRTARSSPHDLQQPLGRSARPADQATAVGAVGPDPLQARHPPATNLQQQPPTRSICTPAVDEQSVHQAESVHEQMALAAFDQLGAIEAALEPTPFHRLD
jgi:hypothetical protein